MTGHPLTGLWRQDLPAFTGWLNLPDPFAAEVMAHAGFDALVIDLQHGLSDAARMVPLLQALEAARVPGLVRAAWNEPAGLMRALDAGACGVICPMVGSGAECEAFVAACRYPPRGLRSFGPTRSLIAFGADYVARAEGLSLAFAQIETASGLANLEAIAAVPGLDGLYVGPWDLSLDLGRPRPGDLSDPELIRACDAVLEAARRHDLVPGIFTGSAEEGARMARRGFRLVNIAVDTALLQRSAAAEVARAKEGLPAQLRNGMAPG